MNKAEWQWKHGLYDKAIHKPCTCSGAGSGDTTMDGRVW